MQLLSKLSEYSIQKKSFEITNYQISNIPIDIKEYLVSLKIAGLSPSTLKNYSLELQLFKEYATIPICSVTSTHIMKYLYECNTRRKVANVTLEHKQIILNGFYNWLFLEHKILENPCLRIKSIKCQSKIIDPLTNIELEQIRLASPTIRDKCLIEVLFSTGMRVSELVSVNISSLDFTRKKLSF